MIHKIHYLYYIDNVTYKVDLLSVSNIPTHVIINAFCKRVCFKCIAIAQMNVALKRIRDFLLLEELDTEAVDVKLTG